MTASPLILDRLHQLDGIAPVASTALQPMAVAASITALLQRLRAWETDFLTGQAPATVAAVRADWQQYVAWCEQAPCSPLPADVEQLAAFLMGAVARGRKRSTLKRYVYTVSLIHTAAGLPSPAQDARWKSKWAAIGQALARRTSSDGRPDNGNASRQAGELVATDIARILASLGRTPRDLRDAALLCLASDTLARESELVRVAVEHLQVNRSTGRWTLWLPFSKTNRLGDEADYRYVDEATVARIRAWQSAAGIQDGLLFRPVGGRRRDVVKAAIANGAEATMVALQPREVARIFRRRAVAAGLPHAWSISGHSTRVGTANDLINAGATTAQIQHAGGWRSSEMVHVYTRRSQAGDNAVADLRNRQRKERAAD
ncbi:tyrosine-type recombinase/integrase [Dyella sp. Tek66A03]|uniref:tyrosine-type recombinase/integrase n=1 Tax=Dyella sp. Tek66A03 TaxID=3458298 RepID=UPI00403E4B3F